jgi:hypothetical protein
MGHRFWHPHETKVLLGLGYQLLNPVGYEKYHIVFADNCLVWYHGQL